MLQSCLEIIHNANGQSQVQILRAPILISRGLSNTERTGACIAEQPDTCRLESGDGLLQKNPSDLGMNQQGLNGVAGSGILHLAVQGNGHSLINVGLDIHIQMAHTIGMTKHGNAGVVLNETHQFITAPGNDQIHQSLKPQQGEAVFTGGEQGECFGGNR